MKTHMTIFQKSETPQAKEKRQDLFGLYPKKWTVKKETSCCRINL